MVVTGWDCDRLELRAECLAHDVAETEERRYREAREVLAIYQDQLARGADPELARVAVDHLRGTADDQMADYSGEADPLWAVGAECGRFGELARRDYLPVISAREAAAFDPTQPVDERDTTADRVAGIAALKGASGPARG